METTNLQTTAKLAATNTPAVAKASAADESNKSSGKVLPLKAESHEVASSKDVINEKVSELNSFVQNIQRSVEFSVHEETGRSIITVRDKDTGDEIRRFPSEQLLNLAAHISETLAVPEERGVGMLINGKA